jgi:P-type Mg2+ transporter
MPAGWRGSWRFFRDFDRLLSENDETAAAAWGFSRTGAEKFPAKTMNAMPDTPGLTQQEAERRLAEDGPNEPAPRRRMSGLLQFFALFANPLVAILVAASVISLVAGQATDAAIIMVIVFSGIVINFWQTSRSQEAADRLRAPVAATATVQRDGAWREVPVREVVAGDPFRLSAGDLVPADARLTASRDLSVQKSALPVV